MNILFFSHDGKLGDAVLHTTLVAGVKECFPDAGIYCTTSGATTQFWKRDPRIRESWVVVRRISYWRMIELGFAIRKKKIDYIIGWNTITSTRLKILCWLTAPRHGTKIFTVKANDHASIKECEALRLLGCNTKSLRYNINPVGGDYSWKCNSIYFNIFAASNLRTISVDMAVAILDGLAEIMPDKTIYITCFGANSPVVDSIISVTRNKNVLKVDCTDNIEKLLSLCAAVDLVVTPDSAPCHIASAFNKPIIALFEKENILAKTNWAPKSEKYHMVDLDENDTGHALAIAEVVRKIKEIADFTAYY